MQLLSGMLLLLVGTVGATHMNVPHLERRAPPRPVQDNQLAIVPFNVTDFYVEVYPELFGDGFLYWVEGNITLLLNEGSVWCYGWASTTTTTSLTSPLARTKCLEDPSISLEFAPASNATATNMTITGVSAPWTFSVSWNESTYSVLTGSHTVLPTDFGLGTTSVGGANSTVYTVLYYKASGEFSMPVTQSTMVPADAAAMGAVSGAEAMKLTTEEEHAAWVQQQHQHQQEDGAAKTAEENANRMKQAKENLVESQFKGTMYRDGMQRKGWSRLV